jgi:tetratricopeptide (TPR) repeat protein
MKTRDCQNGQRLDLKTNHIVDKDFGEHTRPACGQPRKLSGLTFPSGFSEGAEPGTRGACAPQTATPGLSGLRLEARTARLLQWICASVLILVIAAMMPRSWAGDADNAFETANKLYEQGKYSAAAAEYEKLIAAGKVSEALFFNRGNALFKMGQLGRAIASYRQAQLLAPRDADVRENLQFVRTRARGGSMYRAPRWRTLMANLSVNEWTLLTAAALWVVFILLAVRERRRDLKDQLRDGILFAGVAAVAFGICLGITINSLYFTNPAIVVAGEVEVRNGPLDEAPGVFKVRDGAELEVLDQKDGWYQVIDPAQRIGWLRQDEVMLFTPASAQKGRG